MRLGGRIPGQRLAGAPGPLARRLERGGIVEETPHSSLEGVDVSGKTGTAEVGDGTDNLWFIGFTDKVAVAVMLERQTGGTGGGTAAPIAAQVLEALGE